MPGKAMSIFETIDQIKRLAEADQAGDAFAHRQVVETVHKLQLQLESPFDTAMRVRFQPIQNIAVRIAIEYGILQSVGQKQGHDVTAATLAKEAGADEIITERLMRMICYAGYCDEVGENLYRANATTLHVCSPGLLGGEIHHTDIIYPIGGKVAEMMREQGGFYPNPPAGDSSKKDPMQYTHHHRFFDFFAHNEEQRKAFNDYMAARREGYQSQWFDNFPIRDRVTGSTLAAEEVLVCDVGGGYGHELVKFRQKYPDIHGRLVLQDLPSTFECLSLPAVIEAVPHDFFQPQPTRGARFYYMRQIMHDWSDDDCRIILGHLVRAMTADSTLLIDDYVMPPTNAEFRPLHIDVCMMLYLRSEERTQRRWHNLLDSAGLEIVKIWTPDTGFESIIEAKAKRPSPP